MKYYFILLLLLLVSHHSEAHFWNKCWRINVKPNICAILFEDEDCKSESFEIPETQGRSLKLTRKYKNDAESLIVNKGCILQAFEDEFCSGKTYIFSAPGKDSLLRIKELENTNAKEFGNF